MTRLANFRTRRGSKRKPATTDGSMSLMEHLKELRNRLFKCAIAIVLCGIVVFLFYDRVYDFAVHPYCEAIKGTKQTSCRLNYFDLISPFATQLRISTYLGIFTALPVISWQLWRFVAPGLYKNEKKYAVSFVAGSVLLFAMGAALAYYSLPSIFQWLIQQAAGADVLPKAEDYFSLLTLIVVAFGLSFEFPLLLLVAQLIGLVTPAKLASVRRHAIVGIVIVVAVVTPGGDPISLLALSIPLCIFYEASIWLARLMLSRRSRKTAGAT